MPQISQINTAPKVFSLLVSLFILFIIIPDSVFSISKIDSLEICLVNSNDKEKVNILNELSLRSLTISLEKAANYAETALQLAEEINDNAGRITATTLLYNINFQSGKFKEAIDNSKLLIKISEESGDPNTLAKNLDNSAQAYLGMKEFVKAVKLFYISLYIRIKAEDITGIGDSYKNIAQIFEILGDHKSALQYLQKSLIQYKKSNNKTELSSALLKTGIIYKKNGQYEKGIEQINKALKRYQESGDKMNEAVCNKFLGICMNNISKYNDAHTYFEKALSDFEEANNISEVADVNNYIGKLYTQTTRYDKALPVLKNAIQLYEEQMNNAGLASAELNMGILLLKKGSYFNAKKFLHRSLETFLENKNFNLAANTCKKLTIIYNREGIYSLAMKNNSLLVSLMDSIYRNEQRNNTEAQKIIIAINNINNDKIVQLKNEEIQQIKLLEKHKGFIFYTSVTLVIVLMISLTFLIVIYRRKTRLFNLLKDKSYEFEQKVEAGTKDIQTKINEKINAEQKRDLLNSVLEQIEESVIITDLDRKIIYVNNYFEKMTLYAKPEVIGETADFLNSGHNSGDLHEEIFQTISSGHSWKGTLITKRKDGSLFHESACIFPVRNSENKIKYYATVKRDISESIITNDVIEKSEAILHSMLVHNQNSILLIDPQYNILIFNPNAKRDSSEIFGIELEENDSILKFVPQDGIKSFKQNFAQALEGNTLNCEKRINCLNEKDYTFRINFAPVETEDEKVIAVLLSISNKNTL
ncbi:MAG: tetratricopeptide repeat protein [Bacteroidales bacterium]|nr:tetratricopeptide repeat protein [Bacteroidales bacterium]